MGLSIRNCLLSISLLLTLSGCCAVRVAGGGESGNQGEYAVTPVDEPLQYRVYLTGNGFELSGVMVCRLVEGAVAATMMNEFGIKAFDFELRNGHCRVYNAVGPLGRCIVRRTIAGDMGVLFGTDTASAAIDEQGQRRVSAAKRVLTVESDGRVTLQNSRSKMKYVFTPIK